MNKKLKIVTTTIFLIFAFILRVLQTVVVEGRLMAVIMQ